MLMSDTYFILVSLGAAELLGSKDEFIDRQVLVRL